MASSSTTSVHKSFKYDVFLSFRGEDTRTNFIDHLYYALNQKSIYTYKDDEAIKKGKLISDELIRSIEDSKFYIIVFSKNYASSSWCLDELVKIMECHKATDHTAFPVFYDVEPTEVRKQSGTVGEAFAKHEKNEAVGKWKQALKEAADLAGWELKNTANGHEAKFIQKIVEDISLELRFINFRVDEKLVGMDSRVKSVISYLETGVDDVIMIGIKGMGGAGKTTLARAVFNQISFQFEGKSFIENVREVSNSSLYGLKSLQKQVLSNVINDKDIDVDNVYEGKDMMKRRMRGRKVLIVLDDVDHRDQLEALAGEPNWFKSGSRIIITTRDEQVLVAHRVKVIIDVNLLSYKEAICLFSRYAFGREIPVQGYEELSGKVVNYAAGLPLTITVLGSFLCGKNESEWIDALKRLQTIPLKETLKKLELSYLSLEEDYKEIFLNIACILKGWAKDLAIEALESCGFHATTGLKVLQQKCLITISEGYKFPLGYALVVGMHDHIEEMGKNIVRRSHPDKPKKHSRLWIDEEIKDILANEMGTKATRYIRFDLEEVNSEIITKGLRKMKELRFLHMSRDFRHSITRKRKYDNDWHSQYFPNALQYLHWPMYPLWSLPNTFQGDNLVALKMAGSNITELWEGGVRKVLNKLKILDLNHSKLTTLDLGLIPNIEVLSLEVCRDLVQLNMLNKCLKLISINLNYSKLKTVDLRSAVNLELLDLKSCCNLVELRLPTDESLQLISVKISGSKLKTIDLRSAANLRLLDLTSSCDLVELRLPADGCLKLISVKISASKLKTVDLCSAVNLELLYLEDCSALVELHMPGKCVNLRSLRLAKSKLRTLDIGTTPNLEGLDLNSCYNLEELHMADKCQKLLYLNISHSKLKNLDLGLTPNLKNLDLEECHNLVQLHVSSGCLENLVHLVLSGCLRFIVFRFNKRDESLQVGPSAELHLIAKSLERCPLHPNNTLPKFQFECSYRVDPSLTGNLETLISIGLCACTNLETFSKSICGLRCLRKLKIEGYLEAPKELDQLECLEELSLSTTRMKHLPDNICTLKHLKNLKLQSAWCLEKLPEDLGQLECLEELYLSFAKIKHLPDTICMLKQLKVLALHRCLLLEKIPDDLGLVGRLETLVLSFSKIKHLPDTICMLKDLRHLRLDDCSLLEKLPEDLGRVECLKYLNVVGTRISHLQQNICLLKGLRISGSRGLLQSCGFTSEIQIIQDEYKCYVDV